MEIKVYKAGDGKRVEKPILLRLVPCGDDVQLIAVDKRGEDVGAGAILSVTSGGAVNLYSGLTDKIGLKVTEAGYIEVMRI